MSEVDERLDQPYDVKVVQHGTRVGEGRVFAKSQEDAEKMAFETGISLQWSNWVTANDDEERSCVLKGERHPETTQEDRDYPPTASEDREYPPLDAPPADPFDGSTN